jgi:hypothetical protein
MEYYSRPMSSPFWQEDQKRLQNIRSLENKPNLSIFEQLDLTSNRNTAQNLRSQAFGESQFRIGEKESALKERELESQATFQPQQNELRRLGMESEKFGLEDLKKRREIEQTIERGSMSLSEADKRRGIYDPYEAATKTLYGQQLLQQKRLGELGLQKAEFEGSLLSGGGFRASSGSMGSMGSMGQNSIPVGNSWMRSYQVPQFPTR